MTSLLAIDASKFIGWAFFESPAAKPYCRTWEATDSWLSDEYGRYFAQFEEWLTDRLMALSPLVVAFESPLLLPRRKGRGTDEQQVRRLVGVVGIIEKVAWQRNLACHEVNVQDSKAMAGVPSRCPKDMTYGNYKGLMVTAMTALGYDVADDHQADACAVARVVYSELGEL